MELIDIGNGAGVRPLSFRTQKVTIGRADDNDLVFSGDPTVSRHHAVLERVEGGGWQIVDLKSSNGTYINGTRVTTRARIRAGDRIGIGDSTMKLVDEETSILPAISTMKPVVGDSEKSLFSKREQEVLRLVAEGLTDAQIADQLVISVKTVQSHLDRIKDKCGLRRRSELTRFAINSGISQLD